MTATSMPLMVWLPLVALGVIGFGCFVVSFGHQTPEARRLRWRSWFELRYTGTNPFTEVGWRLRLVAYSCFGLALLLLAAWGIVTRSGQH